MQYFLCNFVYLHKLKVLFFIGYLGKKVRHDLRKNIHITDSKVKLPTLAEVKNVIAENIHVDAEYLMWTLEATGAEYAEYDGTKILPANEERKECLCGALVVKSENATVIMMPIQIRR